MLASLHFSEGVVSFGPDQYKIDLIELEKYKDEKGLNILSLKSDIADFELAGQYDLKLFPEQVVGLLNHYYSFLPQKEGLLLSENDFVDMNLHLKKSNLIEEQFMPGFELYPPLDIRAYIDVHNKIVELKTEPVNLGYMGTTFNQNSLNINTSNGQLILDYHCDNVVVIDTSESNKTVFGMDEFNFDMAAMNNNLDFGIKWDNKDSLRLNYGNIRGSFNQTDDKTSFTISQSDVFVNDTLWTIDKNNKIVQDSTGTYFNNVNIYSGVSAFYLEGKLPQKDNDSLRLGFDNWNLSNFDFFTTVFNFDIDGIVNGDLDISIYDNNPTIISDLIIDSLRLNKEYLGTASLVNTWDNINNSISVNSEIVRRGSAGEGKVLAMNGYYYPFKKEESIEIDIGFNRFKLRAIEPFIAEFVTKVEGQASGEFSLRGSIDKPVLQGKVDLRRTSMVINYLNTKYSFSNEIVFEPDRISFDKLVIYDTLGNSARVNGSLKHKYFNESKFDVAINTRKLLFFNTTSKMNDLYYGTAITSGDILISGSPMNIVLNMDVESQDGTDVFLPLDYSAEISDKDYILFVEHIDSTLLDLDEPEGKKKTKENEELSYNINLGMGINPKARITIFMPSDMGRIESIGTGDLRMKTNSAGNFTLAGDYIVESGLFHFALANIVSKRFSLVRGGRISWTGDPYTAIVDIKGLYKVRTTLSALGVPDSSKVNVECFIHLKNQLLDPDIRFEIKFPGLDPDLERLAYASLDTTNIAVMNEQMISLLVLGTFNASNASNVSLNSAYYSVLSNQLSSMLSRISDDFDIGINYRPGEDMTQEEFEVALSTQLFDDRLIIGGNVGMTYERSEPRASSIVGDVDVGYKLTPDGRWFLKAFNHSNADSWYTNPNEKASPYTQGVGIAFRKEFSNIAELFRRSKKKKQDVNNNENGIENEDK